MMHQEQIILPSGSAPPARQTRATAPAQAPPLGSSSNSSSMSSTHLSAQAPIADTSLVKHDEHIARVTIQAYNELDRLSQIAQIATSASIKSPTRSTSGSMTSPLVSPRQAHPKTRSRNGTQNGSTSSMFIKPKMKPKRPAKKMELESMLDRNQNLLKSREVCRLLSGPQLDKLKRETEEIESMIQQQNQGQQDGMLEDTMSHLRVGERSKYGDRSEEPISRGKARLMSSEDNVRLQQANFEAEQEMQRTREYELMGRQMNRLDLTSQNNTHSMSFNNGTPDVDEGDREDDTGRSYRHGEADMAVLDAGDETGWS